MSAYRLTIVIAVQHAQQNLPEIMRQLKPASYADVEYLFCSTEEDPDTGSLVDGFENVVVLSAARGRLIPVLWADGIRQAQAEKIALSTAHCIPAADWVDTLLAADMSSLPAIGGVISNDEAASAKDWAIFFLRYISFAPPQQKRQLDDIAADNAIYRRADILQHADLLAIGFWEPSFHARYRKAGMTLELEPAISVTHHNCYSGAQFFSQRLAHGKEFGLARASVIPAWKRYLLIALSPILPALFLKKIVSAVVRHGGYTSKLLPAFPWLIFFLFAWGMGEAKGYLLAGSRQGLKND